MFVGYQEIISKLKNEIIELKARNITLADKSEAKIEIIKLERDKAILEKKVTSL